MCLTVLCSAMAVVARELAGLEARVERELAADCTTWQQLALTKRRLLEPQYNPPTTEGLTRSERLLWFRRNQQELELDNERNACSPKNFIHALEKNLQKKRDKLVQQDNFNLTI